MTGIVLELNDQYVDLWDRYIDQHDDGTFYHLSGWKQLIEKVYGHRCMFIFWLENQEIKGVLPLVEQKSLLFGHSLVSTPICVLGGIIADSQLIAQKLLKHACTLADQLNVDYLELRSPNDSYILDDNMTMPQPQPHVMIGCALSGTAQDILAGIKKKQRAVIRQSMNNQLVVKIESDIENLYTIYSTSVRNLGTPVFPKQSFIELQKIFGHRCEIFTIFHQDVAVSSVMSFYYKGRVLPHYGGGLSQARDLKSNDFMYYKLMCHAKERGCHYFDFGRSKVGSGSYSYKKHWGMSINPMSYQYYLVKSKQLPSLSASNPKYKFVISLWSKLPLLVSQKIGPLLARHLG